MRTSLTFSVLQAIAATLSIAIIFWSLGLPSFRYAEAASVTSFSDTLSDSAPSAASDHTIEFVNTTALAAGEAITITFDPAFTGVGSLAVDDVDLEVNGTDEALVSGAASGANWGFSTTTTSITITSGTDTIGAGATVTVKVGTVADGGAAQITNPGTEGSREINVLFADGADTGETRVAIVNNVLVTATVDTLFTFAVSGVAGGVDVNGTDTTGGATVANAIPFGELTAGTASTAAQQLSVTTNASNGFVVTAQVDGQLLSGSADIDSFIQGADTSTPTAWNPITATLGDEDTYGHWGLSSSDTTLEAGAATDLYTGGTLFVAASTSPVEVFRHDQPIDGTIGGQGTTTVIYKVETTSLQEAGDYQARLTYIATPVF